MAEHFNKLTPAQAERLALLSEELGEAQQAIGKILRHGYDSYHPVTQVGNKSQLEVELGDVYAAIELLARAKDVDSYNVDDYCNQKLERVKQYLHHQEPTNV